MKIILNLNHETIRNAASALIRHHADPEFIAMVANEPYFNHTHDSPEEVADNILKTMPNVELTIVSYRTFNPFSRVIGHAKGNTIYVNDRKIDLPYLDRVANLFHESLHLIGYSHKGNRVNAYNLKTVPYRVADIFKSYVAEKTVR